MSTTVESLELQIKSNSQAAVSGIDALASSLDKLKKATSGGLGLKNVAKNLTLVKTAVDGMGNMNTKLSGLNRAVEALSRLGNVKISASIGNQIKNISSALSNLDTGNAASKITGLVSALKPLETLGKSTLGTTVNALKKLPEAMAKIDTKKLYGQIQALTRIMQPLAVEMQKIANGFSAFPSRIQKLITENEKLTQSQGKIKQSQDKLATSNNKTGLSFLTLVTKAKLAATAVLKVGHEIATYIKKMSDYIETVNLFNVSMGKYATEASEYAQKVGSIMGIDPAEWMRNQGTFMTLATGFGVVSDRANVMSRNLTQLGYDLSSFFNISYEDAMAKLQSGLAGELEPLRRIGFDLSQARLEQEAYTLGITKKVSAMTQAEKAELRYHAIMTQVTTAQGDMARTIEAPANQLKVLRAEMEQAGRAIGGIFIPALQAVLPYVIAAVKAVRMMAEALATLVGFQMPKVGDMGVDSLASGADDASSALGDAADNAKKLQQYTMGFDELNVIDPNKGSSDSGASTGADTGFDFELPTYDFLGDAIGNESTKILEDAAKLVKDIGKACKEITKITGLDSLWGSFVEASESAKLGVEGLFTAVSLGYEMAMPSLETAGTSLVTAVLSTTQTLSTILGSIFTTVTGNFANYVMTNQGTISAFVASISTNISNVVTLITGIWTSMMGILSSVWESSGAGMFSALVNALLGVGDTIMKLYNEWVAPIIDWLCTAVSELWTNHLSGLFENVLLFVSSAIELVSTLWQNILKPVVDWLIQILAPLVTSIVTNVLQSVLDTIGMISDVISGVIKALRGVLDFLTGVFSLNWEKMWEGIKTIFSGVWDAIWGVVKGVVNLVIDGINTLVGALYSLVSAVVNGIGDFAGMVGSWFGQDWHFEMPEQPPAIPKLMANGGFLETGEMFIAREAGPEMVGSIGRRSAVANNDQIVAGIASGVASANIESNALLREQNGLLRELLEKDLGVYLDGKSLTKSVEKHQRERGRVLVAGGVY